MGVKLPAPSPNQAGVYRDQPDRDDAASTSSAVLMDDFEYPEEELPAYSDEPAPRPTASASGGVPYRFNNTDLSSYEPPPELPFSSHDLNYSEIRTLFPDYSKDAKTLFNMISEQAEFAPTYYCELLGTHTETKRNHIKESKDQITDFCLRINLTPLIYPPITKDVVHIIPSNKRGYRGTRFPSLSPSPNFDLEDAGDTTKAELQSWCERFVTDKAAIKSFTLKREVTNHDTVKLTQLLHACIQKTGYRGHLQVKFATKYDKVIVYSPGLINTWRTTTWVRWFFYLTFLWIVTWPILILITSRYEIVKAVYPYANKKPGQRNEDGLSRVPTVMNEIDWFRRWESAIRRAAFARMRCEDSWLSDEYRLQTQEADSRGQEASRQAPIPSTGNAFADGAIGVLGFGARLAAEYHNATGWGADT